MICLPPIVNLHKLTGNLKHSGKPYEQYNCEGPMCRSVRHCGGKKERKRFYLFRSNLGHPLLSFFSRHIRLSILSSKYCLNLS